jgi:hypothetical protein
LSTNNTDVFLKTLQCLGRTAVFSISLYCVWEAKAQEILISSDTFSITSETHVVVTWMWKDEICCFLCILAWCAWNKCKKGWSFLSFCLSDCLHDSTQQLLDRFGWNLETIHCTF